MERYHEMYAHRFIVSSKEHVKGQEVRTVSAVLSEPVTRYLKKEPHDFNNVANETPTSQ